MWKKLHNPIFDISEQNITVHALQENCNKKTPTKQKYPTTKNQKRAPHTKKRPSHKANCFYIFYPWEGL